MALAKMPPGGSSPVPKPSAARLILVRKEYDAIASMYAKKRGRAATSERNRFKQGRELLDAAVLGRRDDIRAFCKWVEKDLSELPSISISMRIDYSFATLAMFHELVEEHAKDVQTKVVGSPETLLHRETAEAVIHRLGVAIGSLLELVRDCSDDLPRELSTHQWVRLLTSLLKVFALGKVPSQDVAELAADLVSCLVSSKDETLLRSLIDDESFGPSTVGEVLAASYGANVTVSMLQLVNQMTILYLAGDERQAFLRTVFARGIWKDHVRSALIDMFHEKSSPKAAPDFYRTLVNCAADDETHIRPRGFRLVGLIVDGDDLLKDDRNQRRIKDDLVVVYVDLSDLIFRPFDSDGGEISLSFGWKRVSNFARRSNGRFTFETIAKSDEHCGVPVEFLIHDQDVTAFETFVRKCLNQKSDVAESNYSGAALDHNETSPNFDNTVQIADGADVEAALPSGAALSDETPRVVIQPGKPEQSTSVTKPKRKSSSAAPRRSSRAEQSPTTMIASQGSSPLSEMNTPDAVIPSVASAKIPPSDSTRNKSCETVEETPYAAVALRSSPEDSLVRENQRRGISGDDNDLVVATTVHSTPSSERRSPTPKIPFLPVEDDERMPRAATERISPCYGTLALDLTLNQVSSTDASPTALTEDVTDQTTQAESIARFCDPGSQLTPRPSKCEADKLSCVTHKDALSTNMSFRENRSSISPDRCASPAAGINLTLSTPLCAPTPFSSTFPSTANRRWSPFSPLPAPAFWSRAPTPTLFSRAPTPGSPHYRPRTDIESPTPTTSRATHRNRNQSGTVALQATTQEEAVDDVFEAFSSVAPARAAHGQPSKVMSTISRENPAPKTRLEPSLRSPARLESDERPPKRARFDLSPPENTTSRARPAAFGLENPPTDSLNVNKLTQEQGKSNEVPLLFAQVFDPMLRLFTAKVQAPKRAIETARRRVQLSAGATIQNWVDKGNPSLEVLSAAHQQQSAQYDEHLRDVFKRATSENTKRHKRVQSICAEAKQQSAYPHSF